MNRRLLFGISFVLIFAIIVIVWYFFFASPKKAPTLGTPNNPLSTSPPSRFFQFISGEENNSDDSSYSVTEVTPEKEQPLIQIWNKPATGQTFITHEILKEATFVSKNGTSTVTKLIKATSTVLMFVDRITGHIYGYQTDIKKLYQISNTTIPGIYDAYIFNNGRQVIMRFASPDKKTIVSLLSDIPNTQASSSPSPLQNTKYLPSQVTSVSISKKNGAVSYLVAGSLGSSIYTLTTKGSSFITNSPFKEWTISYGGESLYATAKPSAYVEGSTAILPSFNYIISKKTGLMSNPGENGTILNSMWSSTGLVSFLSTKDRNTTLSISTLASKCTWGQKEYLLCAVPESLPKGAEGLPDDWFQGSLFFNDSLFVINPTSGLSSFLYSFSETKKSFDVTHLTLSSDNLLIGFNRKQDETLWLLKINLINVD